MSSQAVLLSDVEVLVFDVFGTVANWRSNVVKQLTDIGKKYSIESVNWNIFADEWRKAYFLHSYAESKRISENGNGPTNADELHRQLLNDLIDSPESPWAHLGQLWNDEERQNITSFWHKLDGWPDVVEGLTELKKKYIIVTLSNGNMRLLVDMAKYARLPWDAVFSTELFDTYKPNPRISPQKCAMVASHVWDLRAAKGCGYKTVYVRRPEEDYGIKDRDPSLVKSREEGGFEEVDFVVDSFVELADAMKGL
ncbi:haloacid dehalogenase [Amanita rubescens]|nr:haloacid dehalogenase [Amanita rubescens]